VVTGARRDPVPPGLALPDRELLAPELPDRALPDRELLDRTAERALRWIDGMRPAFRLPPDVTDGADPNLTVKPLGELAEISRLVVERHPLPALRTLAAGLLDFAWETSRRGEVFAELIRAEPQATYPVEFYGVFAAGGLRNARAEELMRVTTGLRSWRVARGDHTRTLGVLHAVRRVGLPAYSDDRAVLALTGLGSRAEPWALDRTAAYGITHDVFHLTDFGRAARSLPPDLAEYLRLWVPAWLENWADERLWDLAAELLAVLACLPGAPYEARGWQAVAAAQAADGSVAETGAAPPGADPFTSNYHSTLVTVLAATLARSAPDGRRRPAGRRPTGRRPTGPGHESEVTP
jgi:hypothetical protein